MLKLTLALGVVVAVLVAQSSCQKFILPTFKPPVRGHGPRIILPTFRPPLRKQIRLAREACDPLVSLPIAEPKYELHTELPGFDSNRREARSLDSPSAKRGGGGPRTSSGSRNTGATHPGYNRRNAREIRLPSHLNPLRPKPLFPRPTFPAPVPRIPILARTARDIQFPAVKKPTHRDVVIPNWNPHVKTSPWDRLGGRRPRSLGLEDFAVDTDLESVSHERVARDIQIFGQPGIKKPTHRDVVIPNWNPHVKTNPWDHLGGRRGRSITEDLTDETENEFETVPHERETREVHISGLPEFKKPTHRDVIIPNWNPHVRTNPWQRIGGRHH